MLSGERASPACQGLDPLKANLVGVRQKAVRKQWQCRKTAGCCFRKSGLGLVEVVVEAEGAYRALCARCAKSWLFSTTGSSVSSEG